MQREKGRERKRQRGRQVQKKIMRKRVSGREQIALNSERRRKFIFQKHTFISLFLLC